MAKVKITASGTNLDGLTLEGTIDNVAFGLDPATEKSLKDLEQSAKDVINSLKNLKNSTDDFDKKVQDLTKNTTDLNDKLEDLVDTTEESADSVDMFSKNVKKLDKRFGNLDSNLTSTINNLNSLGDSSQHITSAGSSVANSMTGMSGQITSLIGSFASASGMSGNLSGMFAQAAGMMGKSGQGFAAAAGMGTKGIAGMASKANVYAALIEIAVDIFADIVVAGAEFAKFLFVGGNRLSDFTDALHNSISQLPIVGGVLSIFTGILNTVVKTLDGYVDALDKTSANGAAFNNSIMLMRQAAYTAGQTMDQFAATVSNNTQHLTLFGTATQGALKFAQVSNLVRKDLRQLGYTTEEINETLPIAMGILSAGAKARGQSDMELAGSSKFLMTEMDAIAKLTGKNRKAMMDEQAKVAQDAAFRMKMAKLSTEQQTAINAMMVRARETQGEDAAEQIRLMLLGMPPVTEAQRNYAATLGTGNKDLLKFIKGIEDGSVSVEGLADTNEKIREAAEDRLTKQADPKFLDSQENALKTMRQFGTVIAATSAGVNTAFSSQTNTMATLTKAQLNRDGTLNRAAAEAVVAKTREEQKLRNAETESLRSFETNMQDMRTAIFDGIIFPLFDAFKPMLLDFTKFIAEGVKSLTKSLKDPSSIINTVLVPALKSVAKFLKNNWMGILVGIFIAIEPLITTFTLVSTVFFLLGTVVVGLIKILNTGAKWIKDFLIDGKKFSNVFSEIGKQFTDFKDKTLKYVSDKFKTVIESFEDIILAFGQRVGRFFGLDVDKLTARREKLAENKAEREKENGEDTSRTDKTRRPETKDGNQSRKPSPMGETPKSSTLVRKSAQELRDSGLKLNPDTSRDVHAENKELDTRLIELAKKIQTEIPNFNYISSLNDNYHQGSGSSHDKGLAMDFVLKETPSKEEAKKIIEKLKSMGGVGILDEYHNPSARSTGPHFHVEVPPQAKMGGVFSGPMSGYPVMMHGKEMVVPLNPSNLTDGSIQKAINTLIEQTKESKIVKQEPIANVPRIENSFDNVGMMSALKEMIDLQNRSNKLLNTIAQNV